MKTLEQLKQLLINALQGEDYVYYLCQVQNGIVKYGLLEDDDELYYIDVYDNEHMIEAIECIGSCNDYWDYILLRNFDSNADFINYNLETLRSSELRDLYLEKLFTDNYEDTLCDLLIYNYGDEEDECLSDLAEELIALAPEEEYDEEPEDKAKMDLTPLIMEGLSLFDATEDYKSDYIKVLGELLQGISLYMYKHSGGAERCVLSDKEINVMFYTVFRDILLEKGDHFSEQYRASLVDAILLFHDRLLDDLSE